MEGIGVPQVDPTMAVQVRKPNLNIVHRDSRENTCNIDGDQFFDTTVQPVIFLASRSGPK